MSRNDKEHILWSEKVNIYLLYEYIKVAGEIESVVLDENSKLLTCGYCKNNDETLTYEKAIW